MNTDISGRATAFDRRCTLKFTIETVTCVSKKNHTFFIFCLYHWNLFLIFSIRRLLILAKFSIQRLNLFV